MAGSDVESVTMVVGLFEITVYKSPVDGVQVLEIDTTEVPEDASGPRCRIYLNDAALHENPPYPKV